MKFLFLYSLFLPIALDFRIFFIFYSLRQLAKSIDAKGYDYFIFIFLGSDASNSSPFVFLFGKNVNNFTKKLLKKWKLKYFVFRFLSSWFFTEIAWNLLRVDAA